MFEKIKHYYEAELWSFERVKNVVGKAITAEEFEQITGTPYTN